MKSVLLLLSLLVSFSASANDLHANFDIYWMSEVIHGARYDYEGGVSFKLKDSYGEYKSKKACQSISADVILEEVNQAVDLYLSSFGEEEYDLRVGVSELESELSKKNKLEICLNDEKESYYQADGKFLLSINAAW